MDGTKLFLTTPEKKKILNWISSWVYRQRKSGRRKAEIGVREGWQPSRVKFQNPFHFEVCSAGWRWNRRPLSGIPKSSRPIRRCRWKSSENSWRPVWIRRDIQLRSSIPWRLRTNSSAPADTLVCLMCISNNNPIILHLILASNIIKMIKRNFISRTHKI